MKLKIYCIGMVAFGLSILAGCAGLIPPEAAAGMNGTPTRVKSTNDYPEHFAYRIDDHRYITIKGNSNCEGTIYYYDTRLGIRTAVAATGLTLGDGAFSGYYAVDSDYVVIPAIVFSQISGVKLYIYYSQDNGRSFSSFLRGGYAMDEEGILLQGNKLYSINLRRKDSDISPIAGYVDRKNLPPVAYEKQDIERATLFYVDREIKTDPYQPGNVGQPIEIGQIPPGIHSPSGMVKWTCGNTIETNN